MNDINCAVVEGEIVKVTAARDEAQFKLRTTRRWRNEDGEQTDVAELKCAAFGIVGKSVVKYGAGWFVSVVGRLGVDDGGSTQVVCEKIEFKRKEEKECKTKKWKGKLSK